MVYLIWQIYGKHRSRFNMFIICDYHFQYSFLCKTEHFNGRRYRFGWYRVMMFDCRIIGVGCRNIGLVMGPCILVKFLNNERGQKVENLAISVLFSLMETSDWLPNASVEIVLVVIAITLWNDTKVKQHLTSLNPPDLEHIHTTKLICWSRHINGLSLTD